MDLHGGPFWRTGPTISKTFPVHHDGLSFEFLLDTDPFRTEGIQKAYLLSSCSNGLVLYSAEKPVSYPAEDNTRFYYVCNPMTKQWVSLPPRSESNGSDHKMLYCAELVFDASLSYSNYKVVYINADHYTGYLPQKPINLQVHIFSSPTPVNGKRMKFHCLIFKKFFLIWLSIVVSCIGQLKRT